MSKAKVLVISGYGLNCEKETLEAFDAVGIKGKISHINSLIENPRELYQNQILAIPGGFSFGDDTGSGNALSIKIKHHLIDQIYEFREKGNLIIGICNGCQTLVRMFPELKCSLLPNAKGIEYICNWVRLNVIKNTQSIWLRGLESIEISKKLPVAHAEGRFHIHCSVEEFEKAGLTALVYVAEDNPNGSFNDIAAVCDKSGRMLCIMPHPERAIFLHQLNDWPLIKEKNKREPSDSCEKQYGFGYYIFNNIREYFS